MGKRNSKISSFLGLALAVASAQMATAQTRPMPPDPYDPKPADSSTNNSAPVYPAKNDFPSVEVQAVPPAHARVVELRWTMDMARRALMDTVDKLRDDFQASSEMQSAIRSRQLAHERFVAARTSALSEVRKDLRYKTLRSMASDLKNRIEELSQTDAVANAGEIRAFADLRLEYSTKASGMEVDALMADSAYQEARTRLVEASQRVSQLQDNFNRSIKRNVEFVAARNLMSNLNIAYLSSDAYLQSAIEARNIALTYAYKLHYYDQYRYTTAYPYDDSYRYNPNVYQAGYYRSGYSPYYQWNRR